VEVREGLRAELLERASSFEPTDLVRMLAAAAELENLGSLRRSPNPRVPIEMLLLRMSYLDRTVSIEELLGALGGSGAPGSPAGTSGPTAGGAPTTPSTSAPRRAAGSTANAAPAKSATEPATTTASARTPANGHSKIARSAEEAWQDWLDKGPGVPKGLGSFLRSATVTDGPGGRVLISGIAPPASERLAEPAVQHAIREGLTSRLGRVPELVLEGLAPAQTKAARVTEAEVRDHALKALYRQEPRLQKAVEELDLELME
jgi:hypothetical protein